MKKRILTVLFVLMFSITPVMAEIPDISTLTMEELLELQTVVQTAIFENGGELELATGFYKVGEDILAGDYILTETGVGISAVFNDDEQKESYVEASKESSNDSKILRDLGVPFEMMAQGTTYHVKLEDGMILFVQHNNVTIKKNSLPIIP